MWTEQGKAVLDEYRARKAREDRLFEEISRDDMLSRRDEFLLSVGEDVAFFLHDLVTASGAQRIVELGTSYGFSTLFLANAARLTGGQVITIDVADYKQASARESLSRAGLGEHVEWRLGDALEILAELEGPIDFVLLDIWKDLYIPCFEAFYPRLAHRALVAADNMIYPEIYWEAGREYQSRVLAKPDMQSLLLAIGHGIELSTRWLPDQR